MPVLPLDLIYAGSIQSMYVDEESNISGNSLLYLAPNDDNTIKARYDNNRVSSFTGIDKWSRFDNLKSLTTQITANKSRNGITYTSEISFLVPRINSDATQLLDNLLYYKLTAIVKDNNGFYKVYGLGQQLEETVLNVINTDRNYYEVKLVSTQKYKPIEVLSSGVRGLSLTPYFSSVELVDNDGSGNTGGGNSTSNNRFTFNLPFII